MSILRERLERALLECDLIAGDQVQNARFENEKAAVYPVIGIGRFFIEGHHLITLKLRTTKAGRGVNCGEGGELAVGSVK